MNNNHIDFLFPKGLLVSIEARRMKVRGQRNKYCKRAKEACEKETDVTKVIVKTCVFDRKAAEGEEAFKTITDSKICTKARITCKSQEKFIHKGECGKDCDSLSTSCSMYSKKKGGKKAGKKGGKKGEKKGWRKSICDQDGNPLAKKCDIYPMKCKAIANGAKKFDDIPKIKSKIFFQTFFKI